MRVLLDGNFFAEWAGPLAELADFCEVGLERLRWDSEEQAAAQRAAYSRVTMRQARLALLQSDMLHSVEPAINALPEPHRTAAQIEWEYAQTVERDSPLVTLLSADLGLSDEQLDGLFMLASSL